MTGALQLRSLLAAIVVVLAFAAQPAHAVRPDEMLANPALEARAERVGSELRCLVCRNQSIEDSEADLAHDLRLVVRQRIQQGDSDAQVIAYVRSRYGDYVLLKPPLEFVTLALWAGPVVILLLGGATLVLFFWRRRRVAAPEPLSGDEQRRLAAMLGGPRPQPRR